MTFAIARRRARPARAGNAALALLILSVSPASAQASRHLPVVHGPDFSGSLTTAAVVAGASASGSLLLMPLDHAVRERAQQSGLQDNGLIGRVDDTFRWLGSRLPLAGSGAVWLAGAVSQNDEARDIGLHVAESLAAANVVSSVLQRVVGRARPFVGDHDPSRFETGHGFSSRDWRSFPSGHATAAFALSAAVATEADASWGETGLYVAAPLALMTTVTALSRVIDDQHWFSDVVAGAAVGALTSVLVMQANGH